MEKGTELSQSVVFQGQGSKSESRGQQWDSHECGATTMGLMLVGRGLPLTQQGSWVTPQGCPVNLLGRDPALAPAAKTTAQTHGSRKGSAGCHCGHDVQNCRQ